MRDEYVWGLGALGIVFVWVILRLLRELATLQKTVQDGYEKDLRDRISLATEVRHLSTLNSQLNEEARRLSSALKGQVKTQGLWGEMILERVLEQAGLRDGADYTREARGLGLSQEDGRLQKPDVILHIPQGGHLIVDAKVSLTSYERLFARELETDEKKALLKEHVQSLSRHLEGLAKKHYPSIPKLESPELVFLFVPIESALAIALEAAPELLDKAMAARVILATPTSLLAMCLTVGSLWKKVRQNENAQEIARQAGKIYDKAHLFAVDLEKTGKHLEAAQTSYHEAWSKLSQGRDNLLRQTERLRELGVRSKQDLGGFLPD
jgi:DNA recombination protein RmuC